MTNRFTGGVISATAPTVSQASASGVWNLEEAQYYQKAGLWPPGSGADPYFQNTTLLLHGDGTNGAQNNTFVDSSTNNFTITRTGNTTQGSFNPYVGPGNWSAFFDGSGDYLQLPNLSVYNIGSGNFTVECWIYPTALGAYNPVFKNYVGSNANYEIRLVNGKMCPVWGDTVYTGTTTLVVNAWYHIAMVRNGNTLLGYVNGVLDSSNAITGSQSTSNYRIGADQVAANFFSGYISNFRQVVGQAVYTAAFTVPTTPLIATTQTVLLSCNNSGFNDISGANALITRNGGAAVSKFAPFTFYQTNPASYSGYFDGTGDYLTVPAGAAFNLSTSDFCIEMWVYPIAQSLYGALLTFDAGDFPLMIQWASAGSANIRFYAGSSTAWITGMPLTFGTTVVNKWQHLCVTRTSGVFRVFMDGVLGATLSDATAIADSSGSIYIGSNGTTGYATQASISNLRIIKGSVPTAYQTSSTTIGASIFTPSASPLTTTSQGATAANVSLLTCQSTQFIDNSTNAFTITANGNATPKQGNPFTDTVTGPTAYTGSTYAGSAYFDGSGDYLTLTGSSNLAFGSNNFTIEVWIYPTVAADRMIYDGRPNATAGAYPTLYIGSTNQVLYFTAGANRIAGGTIQYYAWNHIALVRSSGTTRLYLNGALIGSYVDANVYLNGTARPIIGADGGNVATLNMLGYLSNLRVVNGTAVYTTPFVPPAAPVTAVSGTQLLVNGTNAGIFDNTTFSELETIGSAQVSTSVVKYGTGSMAFNGTTDAMVMPSQPAVAFGTGNFTIEGWVYFAGAPASTNHSLYTTLVQLASPGDHGVLVRASTTKLIAILQADNTTTLTLTSTNNVTTGQWYHFALTRSGTTARLFLNGTLEASGTSAVNFYETSQALGRIYATSTGATQYLNGYLDDVRVTNGIARYTASFTPPSGPFPNF